MKYLWRRAGFSLLELLVVIALLGVSSTIGIKAFNGMMMHHGDLAVRVQLDSTANDIFASIGRDVEAA